VINTIHHGDCLEVIKTFPDESINCVITSPPYFGLRDYGHDGQIGLEETPELYVQKLVELFREIHRVLRGDGTVWLNLGDGYNGSTQNRTGEHGYNNGRKNRDKRYSMGGIKNLKPKDLIGIPWMVAFALRADGWYLRQDIIWHKPNPMPEGVTDRCTKSHEYIFLLSKSPKYFYDADAIKEKSVDIESHTGRRRRNEGTMAKHDPKNYNFSVRDDGILANTGKIYEKRNKRSVWTVTTKSFSDAHFAVFPEDLIAPCVLAGCSKDGIILDPFFGSGTTGVVALNYGRKFVGVELNEEYIKIAKKRVEPYLKQTTIF
jgi:DNA modification methylase